VHSPSAPLASRAWAVKSQAAEVARQRKPRRLDSRQALGQTVAMARLVLLALLLLISITRPALAVALDGATLGLPWLLPFVGLLLMIAVGPQLFPTLWHAHYGKIAAGWCALTLVPMAVLHGLIAAAEALTHVMSDFISFIILLFALYTVAGGIVISGRMRATPATNTIVLAIGTLLASVIGTTGASMILIRPLLRANEARPHRIHVVVFFIILVANIGGALTPLGDPPLLVGFLRGVDFFWPMQHLWRPTTLVAGVGLLLFFAIDLMVSRREQPAPRPAEEAGSIGVRGGFNIALIAIIIGAVLLSAVWTPGLGFSLLGTQFEAQNIVRDIVILLVALLSVRVSPAEHRLANGFTWEPIVEVAKLFAAIFVAIIPVIAMLQAGRNGVFAPLLELVTAKDGRPHEAAYFWLTGGLSAFLDNAPTYLVFYQLAGGDASVLMGPLAGTLSAISMGAVYMGALTYIGNAPNMMVYAIAEERGVKMPSFFAYLFYASLILLPMFALLTFLPMVASPKL
jgi:Na+/H+ antiporter NhaD/arsenite permease-like protein